MRARRWMALAAFGLAACQQGVSHYDAREGAYQRRVGTVERIDEAARRGEAEPNAGGALVGGIVGGVVGHQVSPEPFATVVGALGGAVVGSRVGSHPSSYMAYTVTVRYDDGTRARIETRVVPNYRVGSRVQVLGATIEPIVVR
ncbi:MAG: glycine zipper 2TM domain-containing protein [Burkholderiales bacterium]